MIKSKRHTKFILNGLAQQVAQYGRYIKI